MSRGAIFEDVAEAAPAFGGVGALLALDLGTKTIGLAIADAARIAASPLETLRRTKFTLDAEALERLVAERAVVGLVLGLPRNMDGSEGPRAQSTRAFARNLAARRAPPIALWDERLTTVAANRALLEADASRKRRAEVVDKLAAALILQGALDRLRTLRSDDADPFWDAPRERRRDVDAP